MFKLKFEAVFTIRVTYKSGNTQMFDALDFRYNKSAYGNEASWEAYGKAHPIYIGIDDIESVYVVNARRVMRVVKSEWVKPWLT